MNLGAHLNMTLPNSSIPFTASGLKGTYMLLDEASVTGTANILMAAVMAKGHTTIFNAACEPYLFQLCNMLVRMGAQIGGIGSNLLTIEGVEELHGCDHTLAVRHDRSGQFHRPGSDDGFGNHHPECGL